MPNISEPVLYLFDFAQSDGNRYFIVGGPHTLYSLNGAVLVPLNLTPFNGDRWQSAILNDNLYLVNAADPIQQFNGITLVPLVETPVAGQTAMPQRARFICNSMNHLMVANLAESGVDVPTRVRWSDIDIPSIWAPVADGVGANEAGFLDIGEGGDPILGIGPVGTQRVAVYKNSSIWVLTYYGRPLIYTVERVVTDEGLLTPYAFCSVADRHYFVGNRDFYMFDGLHLNPIGTARVRQMFFKDISTIPSDVKVFAWPHPSFSEVWWIYRSRDSTTYNKCLVYNWEYNCWCTRDYMPMSAFAIFTEQFKVIINDMTWTFDDPRAQRTWADKEAQGARYVISGDENGSLFIHGKTKLANGREIVGKLETGNLRPLSRVVQTRTRGASFDITGQFVVRLGQKNNPGQEDLQWSEPQPVGEDGRFDQRAVSREYRLRLETTDISSLGEYTLHVQPAGDRQ